jgi:hypothetical protein
LITIPSSELVGLLTDVIPFALAEKDFPNFNCVRVEWDGHMLHTQATDGERIGWTRWDPAAETYDSDDAPLWGGDDTPWSLTLALQDAKDLATVFKLAKKSQYLPLTLTYDWHGHGRLTVDRTKHTLHPAIRVVDQGTDAQFPDVREMLAKATRVEAVEELAFSPKAMANFAKVRPHGPMRMRFHGQKGLVLVTIGNRFTGSVVPARDQRRPASTSPESELDEAA